MLNIEKQEFQTIWYNPAYLKSRSYMNLVISDEQIEFKELGIGDKYFHKSNYWIKRTEKHDTDDGIVLGTGQVITDEYNIEVGTTRLFTSSCTVNIVIEK